jgi:hypothetical protein
MGVALTQGTNVAQNQLSFLDKLNASHVGGYAKGYVASDLGNNDRGPNKNRVDQLIQKYSPISTPDHIESHPGRFALSNVSSPRNINYMSPRQLNFDEASAQAQDHVSITFNTNPPSTQHTYATNME